MYKLKYYSLNKERKSNLKKNFYETNYGKEIKMRLNRLLIIGIMGTIFSIYLFISNNNKWEIISASTLLLASCFFIFQSQRLRIVKLNDYLVKQKK